MAWPTTAVQFHEIDRLSYEQLRYEMILVAEEPGGQEALTPYLDGKNFVTIGAGFNIEGNSYLRQAVFDVILGTAVPTTDEGKAKESEYRNSLKSVILNDIYKDGDEKSLRDALDAVMKARKENPLIDTADKRETFSFASDLEVRSVFDKFAFDYEKKLEAKFRDETYWLRDDARLAIGRVFPTDASQVDLPEFSRERLALFSLVYNEQGNISSQLVDPVLVTDILLGDRAEAWFEIRYRLNGGADPGVAKRRYWESEVFDLFDNERNPGSTNEEKRIAAEEARSILIMQAQNQSKIKEYDELFANPKGNDKIKAAIEDFTTFTDDPQDTVRYSTDLFALAEKRAIEFFAPDHKNVVKHVIVDYGGEKTYTPKVVDGVSISAPVFMPEKNNAKGTNDSDLILGGDGADTLKGGEGNDVILGEKGADQLFGEKGSDVFRYLSVAESSRAAFDTVADFSPSEDVIDLGTLPFTAWLGTAQYTLKSGNSLRWNEALKRLEGYLDGDTVPDFVLHVPSASAGDFRLGENLKLKATANPALVSVAVSPQAEKDGEAKVTFSLSRLLDRPMELAVSLWAKTTDALDLAWDRIFTGSTPDPDGRIEVKGTVVIPPGKPTYELSIPILDNDIPERIEKEFGISASWRTSTGTLRTTKATGVVVDDDVLPNLLVHDFAVDEASGQALFAVSLDRPSAQPITFSWNTLRGTANVVGEPRDYVGKTDQFYTIPENTLSALIPVTIIPDDITEKAEFFKLRVEHIQGATYNTRLDPDGVGRCVIRDANSPAQPVADHFDFPIGNLDAGRRDATEFNDGDGFYVPTFPQVLIANAANFGDQLLPGSRDPRYHLGEDWNYENGGDGGKPVYAVANGTVVFAGDGGKGWQNVVILEHRLPNGESVTSLYGHLGPLDPAVVVGATVARGVELGTIDGTIDAPHLHLEIRDGDNPVKYSVGRGYSDIVRPEGWFDPTDFILSHRTPPRPAHSVFLSDVAKGIGGFKIGGEAAYDNAGASLSTIGDLNGDGRPEILIGTNNGSATPDREAVYVVWGKAYGSTINVREIPATVGGFRIVGEAPEDRAGWSVSAIGDLNSDGLEEILVGAPYNSEGGSYAGAAYVVWGKPDSETVRLSDVSVGIGGFKIVGEAATDTAGISVTSIADLNGDGRPEILVAAPWANSLYYPDLYDANSVYVVWGKGDASTIDLGEVASGNGGFKIFGEGSQGPSVYAVSSIGDLNGDGRPEILIGAVDNAQPADRGGAAYVVWGKADGGAIDLSEVAVGRGGFKISGELPHSVFGHSMSISAIDDLNGDGRSEILVGTPLGNGAGEFAGATYVVWGKADNAPVDLGEIAVGHGGFMIVGGQDDSNAGWAVSAVGDLNGDGRPEILVGGYATDSQPFPPVAAYVVWGKEDANTVYLADVAAGRGGFQVFGADDYDLAGSAVSTVPDLNGDGRDEILIGAPSVYQNGPIPGAAYVVFSDAAFANRPPILNDASFSKRTGSTLPAGTTWQITATDPDDDPLTYALTGDVPTAADGTPLFALDPDTGVLSTTQTMKSPQKYHLLHVAVSDPFGLSDDGNVSINIVYGPGPAPAGVVSQVDEMAMFSTEAADFSHDAWHPSELLLA